jgi:hypothetical protein
MENTSVNKESAIFDRSFNTLASEIEQNVLESLKVATMSGLKTRFCQLLSNEGIVTQSINKEKVICCSSRQRGNAVFGQALV